MDKREEYTKAFAKNLRKAIDAKGINPSTLADMVGTSRSAVSQWLNATRLPRVDKIDKIAEVVGVSRDTLINCKGTEYESFLNTSPEVLEIARAVYTNMDLFALFSETKGATVKDIRDITAILIALKDKVNDVTQVIY